MLDYQIVDISEDIDVSKISESKDCHYCYFLDKGFKFQLNVCNDCHVVLMMSANY